MVALPEYTDDAVPHWGLPIFRETRLLFKASTVIEQEKQKIALLIAKQFTEFVSSFKIFQALHFEMRIFNVPFFLAISGSAITLLSNGGTIYGYKKD